MASSASVDPEPTRTQEEIHEVRITNHGKINAWVDFALQFFEVNEDKALVLHTLPAKHPQKEAVPEKGVVEAGDEQQKRPPAAKNLNVATQTIPRLISVVEIIKREYLKSLTARKSNDMEGLHQYNQIGYLEELEGHGLEGEGDYSKTLQAALSGTKHLAIKRTAYMKVTLSRHELPSLTTEKNITHQKPLKRQMSKSAKGRLKKRIKKENAKAGEEDGATTEVAGAD